MGETSSFDFKIQVTKVIFQHRYPNAILTGFVLDSETRQNNRVHVSAEIGLETKCNSGHCCTFFAP